MLLVSYEFFAFLAVLAVSYYLIPGRFQWLLLLAASYLFYAWGGIAYLLYPVITTVTTWFLAREIGRLDLRNAEDNRNQNCIRKKQKCLMALGLLLNFGIMAVLKYTNFILENVGHVMGLAGVQGEMVYTSWLLPLGLSYYTFQSMGYLVDVYYQKYGPEKNLARLGLFVSFFPQMVSGPISRYEQMNKELYTPHKFDWKQVKLGLERLLWGYFKKLVVADRLGPAVTIMMSAPEEYEGIYGFIAMIGYTVWLYADFSGCMDIVLGVAKILSIRLPENFERPFFSKSLGELWRRWHISLMGWLREYIFLPVSMSRFSRRVSKSVSVMKGKRSGAKARVYVSTLAVWLVSGIWHGASWEFVTWGIANCMVLLISQELTGYYKKFHRRFAFSNTRGYQYFQSIRTFLLFAFLEMFSCYPFRTVLALTGSMVTRFRISQLWDGRFEALGLAKADVGILAFGVVLMFLVSMSARTEDVWERLERRSAILRYMAVFGLFLLVLVTGSYGHGYDARQFIYNQF